MEDRIVTILDFEGQAPVSTDDAERISTLVRKGWTARPDVPTYDPATHQVQWDGAQWVVSAIVLVVPQQISPGQGELQLLREGLLDDVRAVLADPYTPPEMQIAFARATVWERQSPSVIAMLQMLGKTDAEADAFFTAASQIKL